MRSPLVAAACSVALCAAGVLSAAPAGAVTSVDASCITAPGSASFAYTGALQTFTVPESVHSLDITIAGAAGGNFVTPEQTIDPLPGVMPPQYYPERTWPGGAGLKFTTQAEVTPGQELAVVVGGAGGTTTSSVGGGMGQGGGGGSFVYSTPTEPGLLAAAGGGGGSGYAVNGYDAQDIPAGNGGGGTGGSPANSDSGAGGGAGLLGDGSDGADGQAGPGRSTTAGSGGHTAPSFAGGAGGTIPGLDYPGTAGGFGGGGGGGAGSYNGAGGGGGGGYSGGAGASAVSGARVGGAGGTSFSVNAKSDVTTHTGNGLVTLAWTTAHTATFDTQGGSAAPATQTVDSGCALTGPDAPTRDGYTFTGWFTAPASGTLWDFGDPVNADTTLYAQWAPVRENPTIIAQVSSAQPKTPSGWYRSPVTVQFTCTTRGAALVGACPTPVRLTGDGAGQSVSRTINATDGGMATVAVHGINVDQTAPTLRTPGIHAGGTYATAPSPRCRSTDATSGVASCRITRRVISRDGLSKVYAYRAVAVDRAGNRRVVTGQYRKMTTVLDGAPWRRGAFLVHTGRAYTLLVSSASRPVYYDAAVYPATPSRAESGFRKVGHHRWALDVSVTHGMGSHERWNLGVKTGGVVHLLPIRIV